jgi:hypothetical protein
MSCGGHTGARSGRHVCVPNTDLVLLAQLSTTEHMCATAWAQSTPSAHNLQSQPGPKHIQATIASCSCATLALASWLTLSQSAPRVNQQQQVAHVRDFDWDIEPEDGYPSIAFDDANEEEWGHLQVQLHRNAQR